MPQDRTTRPASGPGRLLTGLIGAGIGPSLSPALHEREARELGLDCAYARFDLDELGVAPEAVGDLLARVAAEGLAGVNVTHPAKQAVLRHLDELSPDAAAIGAVNTVVFSGGRAIGHNTDWSGFRDGFVAGLPGAPLDRVVLLGAGGAGAAAAHALLSLGAGSLTVLDVDAGRAARLADDLAARFGSGRAIGSPASALERTLAAADGLVHATPVGMAEHPGLPLPVSVLRPELWVAEIVYRPLETALLRAARARGCRTLDGGRMAVHQAAEALRLFSGREPDPARMLRHLAELVGGEGGAGRVA
ncbi:shikimate dehydrogenase [Amycolatopsis echigonensis]|uniref:Shikimate dehydrogenase (NADP(+)) n=1 Tax=Amycolatopsis echigonensis TaxID=2576905 RepID=A0A2N3WPF4_9PSEU|nr:MULTISPECIES: shikimate dehydrogenase [Amycolatopsis]MBB2501999.1 shikimate dehydrogenase [Amycolatopsis echigonensis]PKV95745.1 shikimate dehydrogenase [Amycolatopsis niigatensis]